MDHTGEQCRISVDGTDFRIYEQSPFSTDWFSHKFKGPGIRYEVGVCIKTGWIVWISGPFPCGKWPDLKIARQALVAALDIGEKFIADSGYRSGGVFSVTPNGANDDKQYMQSKVRARHEVVNRRLKQWGVLGQRFRHDLSVHQTIFYAVANITQMIAEEEKTPFAVEYNE